MFRRTFARLVGSFGRACVALPAVPAAGGPFALVLADFGTGGPEACAERARAVVGATDPAPLGAVIDHPDDAAVDALVAAGAAGVLVKAAPPAALTESLELLLAGERCRPAPAVRVAPEALPEALRARLGARERKMLRLIAGGASVPAVAAELHLTPARVVSDMRRIMELVRGRA